MNQWLLLAGVASVMSLGTSQLVAQPNGGPGGGPGGRNFDPAQMQQRMLERYKELLEVTNDDEWKAIEPRVTKVMEARRDTMGGMGRGMFGRGPGGGVFGTPSPEAEALQKAIDSKASKAELKAALEKYVASRKTKQADLEKSQAALRELLTPRQEAIAALNGLL